MQRIQHMYAAGVTQLAYGIKTEDKSKNAWDFNGYDLWFSDDFNYVLDNWLENALNDIESDITSVDSTNLSEARSEQMSAQSSADRAAQIAAGITPSELTSRPSNCSGSQVMCESTYLSTPSSDDSGDSSDSDTFSESGSMTSMTESETTTPSHSHSQRHEQYHATESDFSGWSESDDDFYTGLSDSEGTSQATGEASTLSSVSFTVIKYTNEYENNFDDAVVNVRDLRDENPNSHDEKKPKFDMTGIDGLEWIGDADNEKILGTSWLDVLFGKAGRDQIYGLEGDDYLTGGDGNDQLFGGGGDDIIHTGQGPDESPSVTLTEGDEDMASGGSGNDTLFGAEFGEALFGGTGHDKLYGQAGEDYLSGGAGRDRVYGGTEDDEIKGGDGDDYLEAGEGDDKVHGGKGDDQIYGNDDEDDLYGDDGDDRIDGGADDDDIWAGEGNDVAIGGYGSDVIRGEAGDDILIGGLDIYGNGDSVNTEYEYIYGNEGNDALFGQNGAQKQYLLGGAGNDYINGWNTASTSNLWGGDGDDFIRQGSGSNTLVTVKGGKGDDVIGELAYDSENQAIGKYTRYYEDMDGNVQQRASGEDFVAGYGGTNNQEEVLEGGAGDDRIWGSANIVTDLTIRGGSGDDSVYGGANTVGDTFLYGNSGKDIVRSDWFRVNGFSGTAANAGGDEYLFGDFKYGEDALDKDLWGDADIIYGGYGDQNAEQNIYGGDGDDQIYLGDNWSGQYAYGENGNDTFYVPQLNYDEVFIRGGDGDDVWVIDSYGELDASNANEDEMFFGQAGNDVIRGSHKKDEDGNEYLYGGEGQDKIYGGDAGEADSSLLVGGRGDDWIEAGSNWTQYGTDNGIDASEFWVYGDGFNYEGADAGDEYQGSYDNVETYGGEDWRTDNGDDVIYGGSNNIGNQYLIGGYGDDKIITGSNNGGETLSVYGDHYAPNDDHPLYGEYDPTRGFADDGDDLIDLGENPDLADYQNAFGQGGNDKIIGGIGTPQTLSGGDGDDKVWVNNPGQTQTANDLSFLYGNNGNDILYGSVKADTLYGDWGEDEYATEGGDDIIYTGVSTDAADGSEAFGGWGNDKIYGQGEGDDELQGGWGDDQIWGGDGDDFLWGDDFSEDTPDFEADSSLDRLTSLDYGIMSGDDTLHGGDGEDKIWAGAGDDFVYGDDDEDYLYGAGGEDTLWGGEGSDYIWTGTGWDTVFGGPGCDSIYSQDGGDVIWGGDCEPEDEIDADDHTFYQWFNISGTGTDPENYTVIMDFWHEQAMSQNRLCLYADASQGIPGSGNCSINPNFGDGDVSDDNLFESCLTAVDILSGRAPEADDFDVKRTRGGGCKNDGGPLWISVELAASPENITNSIGGGDVPRTVWGRIFQKKQEKSRRRRRNRSRRSRYAQVGSYPETKPSELVECMALQICTATGGEMQVMTIPSPP